MPEHLMLSFHGIPQRYFVQGDPYHCHCMKTARLVREELGWEEEKFFMSPSSRGSALSRGCSPILMKLWKGWGLKV